MAEWVTIYSGDSSDVRNFQSNLERKGIASRMESGDPGAIHPVFSIQAPENVLRIPEADLFAREAELARALAEFEGLEPRNWDLPAREQPRMLEVILRRALILALVLQLLCLLTLGLAS